MRHGTFPKAAAAMHPGLTTHPFQPLPHHRHVGRIATWDGALYEPTVGAEGQTRRGKLYQPNVSGLIFEHNNLCFLKGQNYRQCPLTVHMENTNQIAPRSPPKTWWALVSRFWGSRWITNTTRLVALGKATADGQP